MFGPTPESLDSGDFHSESQCFNLKADIFSYLKKKA